ncbi:MAG: HAD family hydrolase [Desulfatibacillaceae bacterium]|nr:HAD family hydrolase [Desulfatibacillaceae bacterium]
MPPQRTMTPFGVIFDLDGTLLDTLADIADAANAALGQAGFDGHPADAYRFFVGDGARMLIYRALPPEARKGASIEQCLASFLAHYQNGWKNRTRPWPGVNEMLANFSRRGISLAVLSNKPHEMTVLSVEHFFPDYDFVRVLGHRDNVPKKPDPGGALTIAAKMSLDPDNIAFVGDSGVDMQTAVNAGMLPVGAAWGYRPIDELLGAGAQKMVERPQDLPAAILGS